MANQFSDQELLDALKNSQQPNASQQYSSLSSLFNQSKPAEAPAITSPVPQPSTEPIVPDYEKMLEDAKASSRQDRMLGGLMRASALANEAGVGHSIDKSGYDDIIKHADDGIDDIKTLQSVRTGKLAEEGKLRDASIEKEMSNPNSSISQASRERIKKAMPEVGKIKDFDKLSAAQLEKLGFKMGSMNQSASYQQTRYVDPATGEVKLGLFNTKTGEIMDTGKAAGFANQFREDPTTGNIISLSPSAPRTTPVNVTGQKHLNTPQMNQSHQPPQGSDTMNLDINKQPEVPQAYKVRETLNPMQRKSVDENTKLYLKDTEKNRDAVVAANNVRALLQAPANGKMDYTILRAIQNQMARGNGEVGAMTENDVAPYGGRATIMGKLERMTQMATVGQLPPEDVKLLSDLSNVMEANARTGIKMQSAPYVANVQRDTGLDDKNAFLMLGGEASTVPRLQQPSDTSKVGPVSGLTQDQRLKRIQELKAKLGN